MIWDRFRHYWLGQVHIEITHYYNFALPMLCNCRYVSLFQYLVELQDFLQRCLLLRWCISTDKNYLFLGAVRANDNSGDPRRDCLKVMQLERF